MILILSVSNTGMRDAPRKPALHAASLTRLNCAITGTFLGLRCSWEARADAPARSGLAPDLTDQDVI